MGWVRKRKEMDWYHVEPNLTKEFSIGISQYVDDVRNPQTEDLVPFFKFDDDRLNLSSFFRSPDKAYEKVLGSSCRSLYLYSSAGQSTVAGNQVTDLTREVTWALEERRRPLSTRAQRRDRNYRDVRGRKEGRKVGILRLGSDKRNLTFQTSGSLFEISFPMQVRNLGYGMDRRWDTRDRTGLGDGMLWY